MSSIKHGNNLKDDSIISSTVQLYIRSNDRHGKWEHAHIDHIAQSNTATYNRIVQIGGQQLVRPTPQRGVGFGNKTVHVRQTLLVMRKSRGMEVQVIPKEQLRKGGTRQGRRLRQTSLGGWCTDKKKNIEPYHKNNLQLLSTDVNSLDKDNSEISQTDTLAHIKKREAQVLAANGSQHPSLSPCQRLAS